MNEPGFVLHARFPDGRVIRHQHGLANLEHQVPITQTTVFNVGSIAKQITARLVFLTPGLSPAALAQHWLPRLKVPDITIGDLIQHRAGLRDAESLLSLAGFRDLDHYTSDDLLELAYRQRQRVVPPGRFLYSNTGYLLLAKVLELEHSAPLDQIAEALIFKPLDMPTARFKHDPRELIPEAATAYERLDGWRSTTTPVTLPGPGSLWCSLEDLDRWLQHFQQAQTERLFLPSVPSDHPRWNYGPGYFTNGRSLFHHGHEQGFSAAVHLTQDSTQVIVLSNHRNLDAGRLADSFITASYPSRIGSLSAKPRPPNPLASPPPHRTQDRDEWQLLGSFTCEEVPGTLQLAQTSTGLVLLRRGSPDPLTSTSPGTFQGPGYILSLDLDLTAEPPDHIQGFTLDMTRAPRLRYERL